MGLRILIAVDFYPPFIGGVEHQLQLAAQALVARGHSVCVVTIWHKGLLENEERDGVQIERVKGLITSLPWFSSNANRRFHPPFPDPAVVISLRRIIKSFRPDVVHANGWIAYSCCIALIGKSIPLLISARDYGYSCAIRTLLNHGQICSGPALRKCIQCATPSYGAAKAFTSVFSILTGRRLLRAKSSAIHCVSSYVQRIVQRDLLDHSSDSGSATPPTVTINSFLELSDSASALENYPKPLPDRPFILFVGALQPHKGIVPLLEAYKTLVSPPPLVLMGTVWHNTPVEFPPEVTVMSNVPHSSVMRAWEKCLFGVAPSLCPETFGGVVLEAMTKRKAMIASQVGGPTDIIVHGESGLLVPPGDVFGLAQAMQFLIDDSVTREAIGQAAYQRAQSFRAQTIIPQFETLYTQLAAAMPGHDVQG